MKKIFTLFSIFMFIGANAQDEAVESKLIKNGFYVETFVGTADTEFTDGLAGGGLKLGNVWYFGSSDFWRPGFKTVWFRGAGYLSDKDAIIQGSIMNVGFANIIEFTPNLGLEANINVGYNIVYTSNDRDYYYDNNYYYNNTYNNGYNNNVYNNRYDSDFTGGGVMINPEIKFRYHILSIGLDFVFSNVKEYSDQTEYNWNGHYTSDPTPLDNYYYNSRNRIKRETGLTAINLTIGAKF